MGRDNISVGENCNFALQIGILWAVAPFLGRFLPSFVGEMPESIPREDYITKAIQALSLKVMGRLFFLIYPVL